MCFYVNTQCLNNWQRAYGHQKVVTVWKCLRPADIDAPYPRSAQHSYQWKPGVHTVDIKLPESGYQCREGFYVYTKRPKQSNYLLSNYVLIVAFTVRPKDVVAASALSWSMGSDGHVLLCKRLVLTKRALAQAEKCLRDHHD